MSAIFHGRTAKTYTYRGWFCRASTGGGDEEKEGEVATETAQGEAGHIRYHTELTQTVLAAQRDSALRRTDTHLLHCRKKVSPTETASSSFARVYCAFSNWSTNRLHGSRALFRRLLVSLTLLTQVPAATGVDRADARMEGRHVRVQGLQPGEGLHVQGARLQRLRHVRPLHVHAALRQTT